MVEPNPDTYQGAVDANFVYCRHCGKMITSRFNAIILMQTNATICCPHCWNHNAYIFDFDDDELGMIEQYKRPEKRSGLNPGAVSYHQKKSYFKRIVVSEPVADLISNEAHKRKIPKSRLMEYLVIMFVDKVPKEIY